ncbi:MAG: FtsX-like permease family protein [Bacteroidota bacterium]|nr:FtsX-like permease family protein [Bacteroidota bacterium]
MVKGREDISIEELESELLGAMRTIRRIGPGQEENFALNKITVFLTFLATIFDRIALFGWVIAGFSILVGGFGISNIMFVSVKERTPIIGIQKALGAKQSFILIQFLSEAVILCIIGGLIALGIIFIQSLGLNAVMPFHLVLTFQNIILGIGISSFIGILSGYLPARQAAKLDPIQAIRYGI